MYFLLNNIIIQSILFLRILYLKKSFVFKIEKDNRLIRIKCQCNIFWVNLTPFSGKAISTFTEIIV